MSDKTNNNPSSNPMAQNDLLKQFTNVKNSQYHSPSQAAVSTQQPSQPTTRSDSSSSASAASKTSQDVKPAKPMSDFARSLYEAAGADPNTLTSPTKQASNSNTFLPPAAQTIDLSTFTGHKFITFDNLVLETGDACAEISDAISWEQCGNNEERCISFITEKCAKKRAFLITSGGLGKEIVPKIHKLPQLYCVYVFCANVTLHQKWASEYSKVRVVCNNDADYLVPQFAVDVAQSNTEWGDALLKAGERDKAKEKFTKAVENLTKYAKRPDQNMVDQTKRKLEELK
jgi:hypothetical protein